MFPHLAAHFLRGPTLLALASLYTATLPWGMGISDLLEAKDKSTERESYTATLLIHPVESSYEYMNSVLNTGFVSIYTCSSTFDDLNMGSSVLCTLYRG